MLQEYPELPILILTACKTEDERVYGLELGADDYVVKPFSPREMMARVKRILRRAGLQGELRYGDLHVDSAAREVYRGREAVLLTKLEFELLLMLAPGYGVVAGAAFETGLGLDFPGIARVVDVRIAALRKKLGDTGDGQLIETVHGVGYKFRS